MIIAFTTAGGLALLVWGFLKLPVFGGRPLRASRAQLQRSPHFKGQQFHNLQTTPALTEGYSMGKVTLEFLFQREKRRTPPAPIPHIKTDLKAMPAEEELLVWFGHSSYYFQAQGKRFLVDPVFSGHASPFRGSIPAFAGSNPYQLNDLPDIDFLLITHDHYDHLDYRTVKQLQSRVGQVVCGLGVGSHLRRWGYRPEQITELDWQESHLLAPNLQLTALPTRHFSGRLLRRNNTLWTAFALEMGGFKLFVGGDSGYGTHFKTIGEQCGPFDLVILENGQYDRKWKYIHMHPAEVVQAAHDLQAKQLLPVHSSKFALANHPWDEPLRLLSSEMKHNNIELLSPQIGQPLWFNRPNQQWETWWEQLQPAVSSR
jgi:L-ascorbate metabolism protein UlaG (beta-lactamase superfamily)